MSKNKFNYFIFLAGVLILASSLGFAASGQLPTNKAITKADCSSEKLGTSIPAKLIGEPVSAVTLDKPVWTDASGSSEAFCSITGEMAPIDKATTARPIKFAVKLPASWNFRSVQEGGAGLNGTVPSFSGGSPGGPGGPSMGNSMNGFALYGSDSGHSSDESEWALNDEAVKNFGYMQLKKTHDAAMVLMERMYGERPRYNYFVGQSQGGREGLTVAQRYPNDYDGISSSVPAIATSTLVLVPVLVRNQEKPLANWVPETKSKAVAFQFIKQCDALDGLTDGIINDYVACREIFNVNDNGRSGNNNPWKDKQCPNDIDPNPNDDSINACFTSKQIETLKFDFSNFKYATPLANNVTSYGMMTPSIIFSFAGPPPSGTPSGMLGASAPSGGRPSGEMPSGAPGGRTPSNGASSGMPGGGINMAGSNLFVSTRYKGQEGASPDSGTLGTSVMLGVTGFIMKDLSANPLDYVEGGKYNDRRVQISQWTDSTNPDLSAFYKHGGKLIVTIGTNDTAVYPGTQLDYYQSLVDKMGKTTLDKFARLYVIPQVGHSLTGTSFIVDGNGKETGSTEIPGNFDQFNLLQNWVEKDTPPGRSVVGTGRNDSGKSMPICSYPTYSKYVSGDKSKASSYTCVAP
jgi:hypothetical protein